MLCPFSCQVRFQFDIEICPQEHNNCRNICIMYRYVKLYFCIMFQFTEFCARVLAKLWHLEQN
jgi:hypothetical protein